MLIKELNFDFIVRQYSKQLQNTRILTIRIHLVLNSLSFYDLFRKYTLSTVTVGSIDAHTWGLIGICYSSEFCCSIVGIIN